MTTAHLERTDRLITSLFLSNLRSSRLLAEEQMTALARDFEHEPLDAIRTAVLAQNWLTPYQFERVRTGQTKGLIIGPYVVLDELGRGGFGRVYRACHMFMRRVVALKVIDTHANDGRVRERRELFLREAVGVTSLEHPNIARAYDANHDQDTLYLAMEYVDGPTMEAYVNRHGRLPVPLACEVMLQVTNALVYTHAQGVVHRDLKPANLLLPGLQPGSQPLMDQDGERTVLVKIIDFGLARVGARSREGMGTILTDVDLVGTPEFMSPEHVRNFHDVDIRSDLYSLGCTFYYALAGRAPLEGDTTLETIMQQLEAEPEPITRLSPETPPAIAAIIHRLIAKKPADRFQTPVDLLAALEEALYGVDESLPVRVEEPMTVPADEGEDFSSHPTPPLFESPPSPAEPPVDAAPIRELWQDWQGVLAGLIQVPAIAPPNEDGYRTLHTKLVHALRREARGDPSVSTRVYAKLETLIEPWLSVRSLTDLDHETRLRLFTTCREYDAELPLLAGRGSNGSWTIVLGVLVATCAAGGLVFAALRAAGRI